MHFGPCRLFLGLGRGLILLCWGLCKAYSLSIPLFLLFLGPGDLTKGEGLVKTNTTSEIAAAPLYIGTFYLESSDNFEAYLTELGVGYILRQLAMLALPIITIDR